MVNAHFPANTADSLEVVLPRDDGALAPVAVWVQTLNTVHRGKVEDAANWAAATEMRRYRKGTDGHAMLTEQFSELEVPQVVAYLLSHKLSEGDFLREAQTKFPVPEQPIRGATDSEERWIETVAKHQEAAELADTNRRNHVLQGITDYEKELLTRRRPMLTAMAVKASVAETFAKHYNETFTTHTIYYAVRKLDSHQERYFNPDPDKGVAEVEDLPDESRTAIVNKYKELDTVSSEAIPT